MWCLSDKQLSQASRLDQPVGVASDHGWGCVAGSSRVTGGHTEWHRVLAFAMRLCWIYVHFSETSKYCDKCQLWLDCQLGCGYDC